MDSNADGIGDFPGILSKLDYLQELGVTCLWMLPFFPSPLRDDGYDIANYVDVNPSYGTLNDFKQVLDAAPSARHAGHDRARHQPHERTSTPGSKPLASPERLARARHVRLEAIPTRSLRAFASSSPIPKNPTGPGTKLLSNTTGIGLLPSTRPQLR